MQAIKDRKLHHLDIRDIRTPSGRIVRIRERRSFDERYYPKLYTYEDVPIKKSK